MFSSGFPFYTLDKLSQPFYTVWKTNIMADKHYIFNPINAPPVPSYDGKGAHRSPIRRNGPKSVVNLQKMVNKMEASSLITINK